MIASSSWCLATWRLNRSTLTETSWAGAITGDVDVVSIEQSLSAHSLQKGQSRARNALATPRPAFSSIFCWLSGKNAWDSDKWVHSSLRGRGPQPHKTQK